MPIIEAPTANPEKAASLMGVSMIREEPNFSNRPSETLYEPLNWATSSPISTTLESRSSSSAIP